MPPPIALGVRRLHSHPQFLLPLSIYSIRPYSAKSHRRPSSSAQPPTSTRVPSTTSTATTSLPNDLNPPPSTRPADLNLPAALPASADTSTKLKRYIALGRAYLSFYKTGLKNVYHNYRASIPLRRALGLPAYIPSSPPRNADLAAAAAADKPHAATGAASVFKAKVAAAQLSRANLQLVRRAAYDLRRMIPFTLILIICGEMTPLVILALGNAVTPLTCRVPGQIAKARRKRVVEKRAALAAQTGSVSDPGMAAEVALLRGLSRAEWVERASVEEVMRACAVFGIGGKRRVNVLAPVYRARLRRYVEYLEVDDGLIRGCGGVGAMEAAEVTIAVEERGGVGVAEGLEGWDAEREERRWLEKWLHAA
jgi:K+-transporting ATPase c subunit